MMDEYFQNTKIYPWDLLNPLSLLNSSAKGKAFRVSGQKMKRGKLQLFSHNSRKPLFLDSCRFMRSRSFFLRLRKSHSRYEREEIVWLWSLLMVVADNLSKFSFSQWLQRPTLKFCPSFEKVTVNPVWSMAVCNLAFVLWGLTRGALGNPHISDFLLVEHVTIF